MPHSHGLRLSDVSTFNLAPTLLQLLGTRATRNSFLGHSLSDALGPHFYLTTTTTAPSTPTALRQFISRRTPAKCT